mgnify:CR=1 FL=1
MTWVIQRVCPREESVYLTKAESSAVRQISVPGAEEAWVDNDLIIIRSRIGYLWEVEPDTGARRRTSSQQILL